MASDTGNSDGTQDGGTYDPNQPISVLGNLPMPSQWSVGAPDSGQPSVLGDALNPPPWTLADSSLNFFVDPETMKTIDFSGDGTQGQGDVAPTDQTPPQPDNGGFYGLTPYLSAGTGEANQLQTNQSQTPENRDTTQAGEYYLPGVGKTYLDPQFADKVGALVTKAQSQNIPLTFSSGYRDRARQAGLKNDPNAITPAKDSLHSAGRAVDVNWGALSQADRDNLVADAASAGLSWGGNFRTPDRRHFFSDPGTDRNLLIDNFSRAIAGLQNGIPDR